VLLGSGARRGRKSIVAEPVNTWQRGFESYTYWPNVSDNQLVFSYILALIANSLAKEYNLMIEFAPRFFD